MKSRSYPDGAPFLPPEILFLFVMGSVTWLLNHPYQGLWHDSRIYALLAAHWIYPQALAPDLFFSYGSQGDLSAFTPLYGEAVRRFGLDQAAKLTVLGGAALWLLAAIGAANSILGRGFAGRLLVFVGAIAAISFAPNGDTFQIGENFATARSVAIPLGFASFVALAAERARLAFVLGAIAFMLHPLHGIWSLCLCLLYRLPATFAGASATLVLTFAAAVGVSNVEMTGLRLMTGDLLAFAREVAPDIVFKANVANRLPEYLVAAVALLAACRLAMPGMRALYVRAALLFFGAMGLALVASFLWPIELLVQAQPWRALSLLLPIAAVALLDVAQRGCRASREPKLLAAGLCGLSAMAVGGMLVPLIVVLAGATFFSDNALNRIDEQIHRRRGLAISFVVVIWLSLLPGTYADLAISGRQMLDPWWSGAERLHGVIAGNSWILAVVLASVSAARLAYPLIAVATLLLVLVLPQWDRRTPERRVEEACYLDARCPDHPFSAIIAPGQVVYWAGHELGIWLELHRASYFGEIQRTGAVFSRSKLVEWRRREALVNGARDPGDLCADKTLDWAVTKTPLAGAGAASTWRGFNLMACSALRNLRP